MGKKIEDYRAETILILRNHKFNQARLQFIEIEIDQIEADIILGDMAVNYDREATSATNVIASPTENKAMRMVSDKCQLLSKKNSLKAQIKKVDIALENMPDPYKTVIKFRYIENQKWKDVYSQVGCYAQEYVRGDISLKAIDMTTAYIFPETINTGLFA